LSLKVPHYGTTTLKRVTDQLFFYGDVTWSICTQKVPEQEKQKEYFCKLSQQKENYMTWGTNIENIMPSLEWGKIIA